MAVAVFAALLLGGAAFANSVVSQGYLVTKPIPSGALVSADPNPGVIQESTVKNANTLLGVTMGDTAVLTITTSAKEVSVATSGIVMTMVSNLNGDIKVGDRITASELSGIGSKAIQNVKVVGVAQGSLDAKTTGAMKTKVKDTKGKEREVLLAQIPVLISISFYTIGDGEKTLVPSFLQSVANSVASKEVSQLPLFISLIIFMVTIMSAFVILYGSIRSSIISVGRNPLAKKSIIGGLIQVVFLVVGLMIVGLAAIFLVLRFV